MVVCSCKNVSERDIRRAIRNGARTVAEIGAACGAGQGAGCCHAVLHTMARDACAERPEGEAGLLSLLPVARQG